MKTKVSSGYEEKNFDLLPDGKRFCFWEDTTKYTKILHVAQKKLSASDENPGTIEKPFKTINAAARMLDPGEKVIIHEGIYRECVRPARGGSAEDKMIMYEVAEGEKVIIKGSEVWKPELIKSTGWRRGNSDNSSDILMADIPEEFFSAYNPFLARNVYHYISTFGRTSEPEWMKKAMLYRGAVYIDGQPMKQVSHYTDLVKTSNAFWVEDPGLRLHLRLPEDKDPEKCLFEVTVREQNFAPKDYGLNYIRVKGFSMEHAADGLPVPQRAALSAMRGQHWIIENNNIEWANACGIDIGGQSWDAERLELNGHQIVRNNVIRNIGICGIAGAGGSNDTLLENNLIEEIGYLDLEHMAETAGIKLHGCHNTLIRGNIVRNISHAGAIWLDCSATNCRVTNNVIACIETALGAVFMEMHYDQNLIDHNIFWDISNDPLHIEKESPAPTEWEYANGTAIRSDCNDHLIVANNFFGKIKEHAVSLNTLQFKRVMEGRTGICFANKVIGNIFYDCPNRIYLAQKFQNEIDGNLYDRSNDETSFMLVFPEPFTVQNLAGWQDFFEFDRNSGQVEITANFDPDTCLLELKITGDILNCDNSNDQSNSINKYVISSAFTAGAIEQSGQTYIIKQKYPINFW